MQRNVVANEAFIEFFGKTPVEIRGRLTEFWSGARPLRRTWQA